MESTRRRHLSSGDGSTELELAQRTEGRILYLEAKRCEAASPGSPHDVDKHEILISPRPRHLQLPDPRLARLNTAVDQRPVNRPWTGPGIHRPCHVYCRTKCGFYGLVRHPYVIVDEMDKHGCTSQSGNLRQVNTAVDHSDVRNPSVTG